MLSVVIPICNEEENIVPLYRSLKETMTQIGEEWELVYVDDGSQDDSLRLLLQLQRSDPSIVVVQLSRNWGHNNALSAGLAVARGDAVVTMDGDLQDPPAVIRDMVVAWRGGAEVVVAHRKSRAERGLKRSLYPLFYKLLGALSDFPIPLNVGIFGLADRKAVDAINALPEKNRYLPGLKALVGFRTEKIFYDRQQRAAGEPKYTWRKLIKYAFDAIFSFSYKPLRLGFILGALAVVAALILGGLAAGANSAGPQNATLKIYGYAIIVALFVIGTQLICLGIVGEYIGRIYDEVRHRPLYLIQAVHRAGGAHVLPISA